MLDKNEFPESVTTLLYMPLTYTPIVVAFISFFFYEQTIQLAQRIEM